MLTLFILDLTKDFDTVNHTRSPEKINRHFGIRGLVLQLLKSYLLNRKIGGNAQNRTTLNQKTFKSLAVYHKDHLLVLYFLTIHK